MNILPKTQSLAQWVDRATPGERIVYFVGGYFTKDDPACKEYLKLEADGFVIHAGSKRIGVNEYAYFAAKPKRPPKRDTGPVRCGQVRSDYAKAAREQQSKDRVAVTAQRLMAGHRVSDIAAELNVHIRTAQDYAKKARDMGMVE